MSEGSTYISNERILDRLREAGTLDHFDFGVRDNVFSWWCTSPDCQRGNGQAAAQQRKELASRTLEQRPQSVLPVYGIREKHFTCTLDSFQGHPKVVSAARQYAANPDQSLLISGNCGSGKTHIAVAILREMLKQGKRDLMFKSVPELMLDLRNSFEESSTTTEEEIINQFSYYKTLVLDDLGAEKFSEYAVQCLYLIIERRLNAGKTTIITTNMNIEEINDTLSSRIASRLSEYRVFKFTMSDYRTRR